MKKRDLAAGLAYEQKLEWFRSRTGRQIWCGIAWPEHDKIHGYHVWTVMKVDSTEGGVDFVLFSDPVGGNQWRIPVEFVWKAADEEPAPEFRDYERQWCRGLLAKPDVEQVIKAAGAAQLDDKPRGFDPTGIS